MKKLWRIGTRVNSMIKIYIDANSYEELLLNNKNKEMASNRTLVQRFQLFAYFKLIDFGPNIRVIDREYHFSEKIYNNEYDDIFITSLIKNNEYVKKSFLNMTEKEVYNKVREVFLENIDVFLGKFDSITYYIFSTILYENSSEDDRKYFERINGGKDNRSLSDWSIPNLSNDETIVNIVLDKYKVNNKIENIDKVEFRDYRIDTSFQLNKYLKVNSFTINELFNTFNKGNIFRIPYYQRNYVWDKALVRTLVYDIKNASVENPKLLPAINCSVKQEGFGVEYDASYNIVDGQQRITTIYLIYNAILKVSSSEVLQKQDYFSLKDSAQYLYFINGSTNAQMYNKIIKNIEFSMEEREINLVKIYIYLIELLQEFTPQELIDFSSSFLNYTIIPIIQDTISNEIDLFDRLNSNNIPITIFDKLKALLFSEYLQNNPTEANEDELSLDFDAKITNKIKTYDLKSNQLFKVFCRTLNINGENENEKLNNYIEKVKNEYNNNLSLNNLNTSVNELEKFINQYIYIYKDENLENLENKENILLLSDFTYMFRNREIYYPILINLFNKVNKNNYTEIRNYLFEIEKFEVKFKLVQNSGHSLTNVIDRIYIRSAYNDNLDLKHIKYILNEDESTSYSYNCTDKLFTSALRSPIKDSTLVCRLLYRIVFIDNNSHIDIKHNSKIDVSIKSPSDEHILPQTFEGKKNDEEYKEAIQLLGNRLLINKDDNAQLGNNSFKEKKQIYSKLAYLKNNYLYKNEKKEIDISKKEKFEISDIKDRNNELINKLIEIYFEL